MPRWLIYGCIVLTLSGLAAPIAAIGGLLAFGYAIITRRTLEEDAVVPLLGLALVIVLLLIAWASVGRF